MATGMTMVLKAAGKGRAVASQNQAKPLPLQANKNTAGTTAAKVAAASAKSTREAGPHWHE